MPKAHRTARERVNQLPVRKRASGPLACPESNIASGYRESFDMSAKSHHLRTPSGPMAEW